MALDAGSVFATLGGRFDPAAFAAFDSAIKKSAANAEAGESRIRTASSRMANSVPLKTMDQLSSNSKKAADNLATVGKVATTGAAVGLLAVGAATAYAVTKAVSFNTELLKLHTQAGASADEVSRFKGEILGLAGEVPQGPKELTEGLYHVVSAGFRGAQALDILKAAAKGAALGGADLEDTTNALIGTIASQIKGVHGAADAQGDLNAIVGIGNERMEDLAKSIGTGVLPTFAHAGLTIDDFGASLATVTDNATPANVTATRLRMTIALMEAPSAAAVKQLKSIGLTSTSLAHDLRQPNGLLLAVEDLKTHLKDSGKSAEEQDAILSHVFGGGKSSAVINTLIDETGRLKQKYAELEETKGVERLNESWAEFQKSGKADFAELKSSGEAFAVVVGNTVLPELTKLAKGGSSALAGFEKSGGAAKVGQDITRGFNTAGQVISDVAPDIETVAKALFDVGKAGSDVGNALGIGVAGQVETAAAAFLAFKGAQFVAPMLLTIGGAMSTVGTAAATAPSIAAFGADLLEMTNPVTAIAGVVGLAAGAFIAFKSGLLSNKSEAEEDAKAVRELTKATEELQAVTVKTANAEVNAKQAKKEHKEAGEKVKKVNDEIAKKEITGGAATSARQDAQQQFVSTGLRVASTSEESQKALAAETKQIEGAEKAAIKRLAVTEREISEAQNLINTGYERVRGEEQLIQLQARLTMQQEQMAQGLAVLAVAEESRNRLKAGEDAIKPENAIGVEELQPTLDAVPKSVRTRVELEDQGAQASLGKLAGQLAVLGQAKFVATVVTTAPTAQAAVEALTARLHGIPASRVLQVLAKTGSAAEQIEAFKALIAGVKPSKVISIITNARSQQAAIEGLAGSIASLQNKDVTVTTHLVQVGSALKSPFDNSPKHASGRPSGTREAAIVGEGQGSEYVVDRRTGEGTVVSRPTLMGLGADDYVIPLEQRYRGRALGLFAKLAKDLDIPGYKDGKGTPAKTKKHAPAKKPMPIPDAIPPLSLPLSEIEQKEQTAKGRYEKAAKKVTSLEGKVKTAERNVKYASKKGNTKAKDQAKLSELQKELKKAKESNDYLVEHKKMEEWKRTLADAKRFQTQINDARLKAENATNAMKLAADHDDPAAYEVAKQQRTGALAQLQKLIKKAQKEIKTGSEYALQMEGQLQQAQVETGSTEGEEFEAPKNPAAEREEQTGMTDAEAAQLKEINKDIALAALTPSLEDDKSTAAQLQGFFERVLGEAIAEPQARGGDEVIASLAGQLKTARQNVESLTGNGTNENQDLQAQINQANERAEVAQRNAQIAEQALSVFGGSGDIGAGGANAAQAAGVVIHQTNNMLHPSDPAVLTTIGNAATAGIGLQGSRRAVRLVPGI